MKYECAFPNSNPYQNLFYNLCKGSKHTYGAAGHYVSYLYCRSLSHVEITLMNAYIKGAISKQILRYLATFKREMLNLWLPSLQALTALHLLNMLAKMIIWHSLYYSKHSELLRYFIFEKNRGFIIFKFVKLIVNDICHHLTLF